MCIYIYIHIIHKFNILSHDPDTTGATAPTFRTNLGSLPQQKQRGIATSSMSLPTKYPRRNHNHSKSCGKMCKTYENPWGKPKLIIHGEVFTSFPMFTGNWQTENCTHLQKGLGKWFWYGKCKNIFEEHIAHDAHDSLSDSVITANLHNQQHIPL